MKRKASTSAQRKTVRTAALALLALLVTACAQATRETFDLTAGALRSGALRGGPAVFVPVPAAGAPTSSDRIVVRAADDSVAVLPGVQWSDPLPRLFQRRLIEALQQCGLSASAEIGAQTKLQADVRRFEIDIARDLAVIEVSVELVDGGGRSRAARIFVEESPAPDHIGSQAARALSDAAARLALRIGQWTRARL